MTRKEIWDLAVTVAKQTTQLFGLDAGLGLYDMSVAEQKIEQRTGIVRRTLAVTLDPDSTDGEYELPADIDGIEVVTWSPDADTKAWYPVKLWTADAWRQQVTSQQGVAMPIVAPASGGDLYVAVEDGTLLVYPFGSKGVLTLKYRPILTPYSPTSPLWADFAANPETHMLVTGLDDEKMNLAIDGIVNYMAAKLLKRVPGGPQMYAPEIRDCMRVWEDALSAVSRASISNANRTPPRLRPFGGVH